MKMIRAVVRPEREEDVVKSLENAGFPSMTKMDVLGRGKQKGIQVGSAVYDELAKTMVMVVVEDAMLDKALAAITDSARTGNYGDGKIFISPVDNAITVRTGKSSI